MRLPPARQPPLPLPPQRQQQHGRRRPRQGVARSLPPPPPPAPSSPSGPPRPIISLPQQYAPRYLPLNTPSALPLALEALRLLQRLHSAGVYHRDVKPGNFVRVGRRHEDRGFRAIDFGLSKSFIEERNNNNNKGGHKEGETPDETNADGGTGPGTKPVAFTLPKQQQRQPQQQQQQPDFVLKGERKRMDFRGTAQYASLRVHESKDYCRRDDIWSLLYVFVDLLTGDLPWRSLYDDKKDKGPLRVCKAQCLEDVALLLPPDFFEKAGTLSEGGGGKAKVLEGLRDAFLLVSSLAFADVPDYASIEEALAKCCEGLSPSRPGAVDIRWEESDDKGAGGQPPSDAKPEGLELELLRYQARDLEAAGRRREAGTSSDGTSSSASLPAFPPLTSSSSGTSSAPPAKETLRTWMKCADRALKRKTAATRGRPLTDCRRSDFLDSLDELLHLNKRLRCVPFAGASDHAAATPLLKLPAQEQLKAMRRMPGTLLAEIEIAAERERARAPGPQQLR